MKTRWKNAVNTNVDQNHRTLVDVDSAQKHTVLKID